jgi:hypothetical protein
MKKKKNRPKRIPHSVKKYIRKEKARLRRESLDKEEYKEKVQELYQRIS